MLWLLAGLLGDKSPPW